MQQFYKGIITLVIVKVLVFGQVSIAQNTSPTIKPGPRTKEIRSGQYGNLVNPLLDCYNLQASTSREIKTIKDNISKYILAQKAKKNVESISVYYRELNNGDWIGINENETYSPASLLKVPVMIAALKQVEVDSSFLKKKVEYFNMNDGFNQNIADSIHLQFGKKYTIERLIEQMIDYSDNFSKDLIVQNLWTEIYEKVYYDLGINIYPQNAPEEVLSVKDYASFFRVLYNASYLNKDMSLKALTILTKSKFDNGIEAGLPPNVLLANKFGERTYANSKIKQLHDCGIVYKNNMPYILCVMVKGYDFGVMENVIANISKIAYNGTSLTTSSVK